MNSNFENQVLEHLKAIRADVQDLKARTTKLDTDDDARLAEMHPIHAEMRKMNAYTDSVQAEAALILKKSTWYPIAVGAGATLALLSAILGVFKLLM